MDLSPRKRLGELLVAGGVITLAQLDEALAAQRATGEFLGAVLVRRGWVTEGQLLNALSAQFGIPRVRLSAETIDGRAAEAFSPSLMVQGTCFPIRWDVGSLTVAIANPLDAWTVSAIEREARGRMVRVVLATQSEITEAIRQHHQRVVRAGALLVGGSHAC